MTARPLPPAEAPGAVAARAHALRQLELEVRTRLDGLLVGDHLTAALGPGDETAGVRRYEPGDDARRIDWNLSARMLEPHVRTTQANRELETWIVADRSASLDFGTTQHEKREVVLAMVAAFGFLSARNGNRLGVVTVGGSSVQRRPAATGQVGLLAALAALYDEPRSDGPPADGAELADGLAQLARWAPRRGQVVVVSDFLDPSPWADELARLAQRHQVICVQVGDPREREVPPVGMLAVIDVETGRRLHVQTNRAALRERYAEAARARDDRIRTAIAEAGAEHLVVSTEDDWLHVVATFAGRRRQERVRRGHHAFPIPSRAGA